MPSRFSTRRTLSAFALALATGAALLAPIAGPAHAADDLGKPKVGECHKLSSAQVAKVSDSSKPVDCSKYHTTVVAGVPNLPQGLTWNSPKDRLVEAAVRACLPQVARRVGGSFAQRQQTAFELAYFFPTSSQKEAGARWIRCDVTLRSAGGYLELPETKPFLKKGITDDIRRCAAGPDRNLRITACSQKHGWRAAGTFTIHQKRYPTMAQSKRAAFAHCPKLVRSNRFFYYTPGTYNWDIGGRSFTCMEETTH